MSFQSTVSLFMGNGVPGELFDDGPHRGQPYTINSALASYNIFGTAFSITSQGFAAAGNTTGSLVFAGILVNPKTSASYGTLAGGPLAPTLTLPNFAPAELLQMGSIWVTLPGAANIGDTVIFDNTTGELSTIAPGVSLPSLKSPAFAFVDRFTVTGAGLALITMTQFPSIT